MEKQCCWKAGELHKRKKCGRLFQAKIRCKMSEINKILFKPKFLYVKGLIHIKLKICLLKSSIHNS